MIAKCLKSSWTAPVLIILVVLAANFIYLAGITNPNPLNTRSGLSNTLQNGPIRGYNDIDPNDGFGTQAFGKQAVEDVLHGKLPWWNYNEQVGAPLAGEMQSAALFPPTILLGLSTGMTYFHIFLEITAGLSTYYLLRKLGLRQITSVVGGSVFALSSGFVWFWSANTNPIAFLPLLILGIELAYSAAAAKKKRGWFVITAALALSIYAGFPEVTFIDGLLGLCWALTRLYQSAPGAKRPYFKKLLAGGVSGVLIAAPVLVAFLDYLPYADVGAHTGGIVASVNAIGVPALFMPYIYGSIFGLSSYDVTGNLNYWWSNVGGYVTLLMAFFALLGLAGVRRTSKDRPLKVMLAAWITVLVLRIYGFPGFPTALAKIPGVGKTAIYRYSQPALVFAVVVLMAFGLEYIINTKNFRKPDLKKIYWCAAGILVTLLAVLPQALHEHSRLAGVHHQRLWLVVSVGWAVASVAAALLLILLLARKKLSNNRATYLLAGLILLDTMVMFIIPQLSAPRSATINTRPITYLQKNLGDYRFYSLGPVMPNYGSYFDIASIDTNNVPISKNWARYVSHHLGSNLNPLVLTGEAGNSLNPTGQTPAQAFLQNISSYEYVGVKYLVASNGTLTPLDAAAAKLQVAYQDNTAIIYALPHPAPYFQAAQGNCSLQAAGKTDLTVNCSKPSVLLRRELYMPGWGASINNHRGAVKAYGPLFQGIDVPAGQSHVEFSYTPQHMPLAVLALCIGLAIVLGAYLSLLRAKL